MNWTIFTICCAVLAVCVLLLLAGIGIGMSIKSEDEKQEAFKKFVKWLEKQEEENK